MSESIGELFVPNVGEGDITVAFNKEDKGETAKALRMLRDMQRRGFAILVRLDDGTYQRVEAVDEMRGLYIVSLPDGEPEDASAYAEPVRAESIELCGVIGHEGDRELVCARPRFPIHSGKHQDSDGTVFSVKKGAKRKGDRRRGRSKVGVPIRRSRAAGIARSAGG